jgi:hypothetical protein
MLRLEVAVLTKKAQYIADTRNYKNDTIADCLCYCTVPSLTNRQVTVISRLLAVTA